VRIYAAKFFRGAVLVGGVLFVYGGLDVIGGTAGEAGGEEVVDVNGSDWWNRVLDV
jgi:hypothetical protein